ncbi:MAG: ATP-binding cassette domain-containing protein [Mogibacterium sp.]|nr:ATP-binding cassette domain-containing protein [Mogibacterium sp.]
MGIYTEALKNRERNDLELERNAELRMMNRLDRDPKFNDADGAFFALNHILGKFGLSANEVHGYSGTQEMLDLALDPLAIIYDIVDLSDTEWTKRTEYILGFMEDGRAVVLSPAVRGYTYRCLTDGSHGWVRKDTPLQQFAYAIQRPLDRRVRNLVTLAIYTLHLVSARDIIAIGGATLAISLLGLITPKMNQYVLREIVPMGTDGYTLLFRAFGLFLSAGMVKGAIQAVKSVSLGKMRIRISSEVQSAVMTKVLTLPQSFFTQVSTGKLSKQISNARFLSEQIISFVLGASLTAVFSLVYIPQMAGFSRVLLIPAVVILIIRSVYTLMAGYLFADNERRRQEAEMDERAFLFSTFKGIQRIKESGAEKRIFSRWTSKYSAVLDCDLNMPVALSLEDVVLSFLSSLGTVILLSLIIPAGIDKADYIAFTSAFGLISAAVTELMDAQRKLFLMRPMMEQLRGLFESEPEDAPEKSVVRNIRGSIKVENVSFAYDEGRFGCLNGVSLDIAAGEKVAIVGESGCGKSTLLKIILGALKPDEGAVLIDGMPLESLNLRSYRRHIGAVFQFSKVMPGTIYSNIAFCPHPVSLEEAKAAAEKADIAETIERLPLGYETEISDSNTGGFSGGQRQRLLLARAFASKPDIMILDEATSALDNISQNKVLDSVYKENCTVVMVAHRLSTVRDCDRIVLIKEGRIAEQGTYDDLMKLRGEFYELMRRQSGTH